MDDKVITKILIDFDDTLFPSTSYLGRERYDIEFNNKFSKLKKNIDFVIFKLMQLYGKENVIILSAADYDWVSNLLTENDYLLAAYKTSIISTRKWKFNANDSFESKRYIMNYLLKQWKVSESRKPENIHKNIKFRLISIGDALFEFLACYDIGFDYVNRIKLLDSPSVCQLINVWNFILDLTKNDIYNQNIVFVNDFQFYYLTQDKMNTLHKYAKKNGINQCWAIMSILLYGNNL